MMPISRGVRSMPSALTVLNPCRDPSMHHELYQIVNDSNQRLLTKIEALMSAITQVISEIATKVTALEAKVTDSQNQVTDLQNQLSAAQAALATAQANSFDAADVQALNDLLAKIG
jgi:predicted  nucleic acid-binding Zn-ribbon protein